MKFPKIRPWKQLYLAATVKALGRFARYRIISKTMLPKYAIDAEWARVPAKKRRPDREVMEIVEPFSWDRDGKKVMLREVSWWGIPNHAMLPINVAARIIFDAFIQVAGAPPVVPDMKQSWTTKRAEDRSSPRTNLSSLYRSRDQGAA